MRSARYSALAMLCTLLLAAVPALAHHSASAEFDMTKSFSVKGVLTKVDYENPHCFYYIETKDADGKVTSWSFEGQPPSFMHRGGVTREFIMSLIGTTVSMSAFAAKDGTKTLGLGHDMILPDGRVIQIGPR